MFVTQQKKPPRLIDITQYGIPERMRTVMLECPKCKNQWVVTVLAEGFVFEKDLTCKKCGTVIVDLSQ